MIKVLIVDDSRQTLLLHEAMIIDILDSNDNEIFLAQSGDEASELIESHRFDLVMTDLLMPDGNGLKVLEKCHEAKTTTIIVSKFNGCYDRDVACAAGNQWLDKPLNEQALREAMRKEPSIQGFLGDR